MSTRTIPDPSSLLDQIPTRYRGSAGDAICRAVRDGCRTPRSVVRWLMQRRDRIAYQGMWSHLLPAIDSDPDAAREAARYYIIHERDPDRLAEMERREREARPTTERQRRYLRRLGHQGPIPKRRMEASRLISRYVNDEGGSR